MGNTVTATRITPRTRLSRNQRVCARCGIEFGTSDKKPQAECRDCRAVAKGPRTRRGS